MKVLVKSGNRTIRIAIPTCMVFSRLTARLGARFGLRCAGDEARDFTPGQMDALFAEFRRIKKRYGRWELVDMESSDGKLIKIIL